MHALYHSVALGREGGALVRDERAVMRSKMQRGGLARRGS